MKKTLLFIVIALLAIPAVSAQKYSWGVGIRAGVESTGIDVRHNFDAANAFEAILAFPYDKGFVVTGLYERNVPLSADGLNFIYGAGAHLGEWNKKFSFGADAIIGLEYSIPNAPIAIGIDYKPVLNIVKKLKFYAFDFGFSVKFTF